MLAGPRRRRAVSFAAAIQRRTAIHHAFTFGWVARILRARIHAVTTLAALVVAALLPVVATAEAFAIGGTALGVGLFAGAVAVIHALVALVHAAVQLTFALFDTAGIVVTRIFTPVGRAALPGVAIAGVARTAAAGAGCWIAVGVTVGAVDVLFHACVGAVKIVGLRAIWITLRAAAAVLGSAWVVTRPGLSVGCEALVRTAAGSPATSTRPRYRIAVGFSRIVALNALFDACVGTAIAFIGIVKAIDVAG